VTPERRISCGQWDLKGALGQNRAAVSHGEVPDRPRNGEHRLLRHLRRAGQRHARRRPAARGREAPRSGSESGERRPDLPGLRGAGAGSVLRRVRSAPPGPRRVRRVRRAGGRVPVGPGVLRAAGVAVPAGHQAGGVVLALGPGGAAFAVELPVPAGPVPAGPVSPGPVSADLVAAGPGPAGLGAAGPGRVAVVVEPGDADPGGATSPVEPPGGSADPEELPGGSACPVGLPGGSAGPVGPPGGSAGPVERHG